MFRIKNTGFLHILVDLIPRVKLLLGTTNIKATIPEIVVSTAAIDRFSRLVFSNRQTIQSDSCRKAVKLAKAFRHIRAYANSLYLAITDGFREECHTHEMRLYLEERVDIAADILQRDGKGNSTASLMNFVLVFTAGRQVFDKEGCDNNFKVSLDNLTRQDNRADTLVRLSFISQRTPSPLKPAIASVAGICSRKAAAPNAASHSRSKAASRSGPS